MPAKADEQIRPECFHPSGKFVEFPKEDVETSIPERFEKIVRMYPDQLAIKTPERTLTYHELNSAANRVASAIHAELGEGQEPVALLFENGIQAIIAVLGVLKAGKFYVPVDPSFPRRMIVSILEDCGAKLILTHGQYFSFAKALAAEARSVISIDELDSADSPGNPGLSISPDAFSWIRYTSGSTGQPKGVFNNHRNVLFHTMNNTNGLHICLQDRINAQGHDFFSTLLNGASLYPLNFKAEGINRLPSWLIRNQITIHYSSPTVFRHLLGALTGAENFPNLRLVTLEGEVLYKRDVELYKRHFHGKCVLVNKLGSRETAAFRQFFIDKNTEIGGDVVPVGYAIEGKEIFLLDDHGREVSSGQVGEIAVKSRFLALGYWRRSDLTKEAFIGDPQGGNERIYRTRDLGRMLPDGCLMYLGRKDFQVKIRGNQVNTREVEVVLLEHTGIKQVAVVADKAQGEETRLVAYYVPSGKSVPTVSELRSYMGKRLPDYMIPSVFVMLEAPPLTPAGKIDRMALPSPASARPDVNTPYLAPRTPVEKELANIWTEVLSLDQVGVYDNFFDLGGHSLTATRIVARVFQQFQLEIPLQVLFESPTVAEMAGVINEYQGKKLSVKKLEQILTELESLSEDEAQKRLSEGGSRIVKDE